jgi:hypothetical protein
VFIQKIDFTNLENMFKLAPMTVNVENASNSSPEHTLAPSQHSPPKATILDTKRLQNVGRCSTRVVLRLVEKRFSRIKVSELAHLHLTIYTAPPSTMYV